MAEARRYRFAPLERRGLLLGLSGVQLATVAAGCVVALGVVRAGSSGDGLVEAFIVVAVSGFLACWPVAGQPPVKWAPVVAAWALRRSKGARLSSLPLVGRSTLGSARLDSLGGTTLPVRGAPGTWLPGVRVVAAPALPGAEPLGVVSDQLGAAWSALLRIEGRSFALLDTADKERRLAAWGSLLATLARPGSPIHRVQWIERSAQGCSDQLQDYLAVAGHGEVTPAARRSYTELIAGAGPATAAHETLLVISVHPRRAGRALRSFGRGESAICELLQREVRLLCGHLRGGELPGMRPMSPADVLDALATTTADPTTPKRTGRQGDGPHGGTSRAGSSLDAAQRYRGLRAIQGVWPMATDEAWSTVRADAGWFATYWVAEWPRLDVGPDFLSPLLLAGGRRTVSVIMAPVDPQRAVREVGSARTADMADEELRRRAGFVPSTQRRREAEGVVQREGELADGHAEYRFSGYVTVAGADRAGLESACAEVEQAARRAHLELRRLYGRQEEALTWTMPLGRGLS